jgi:peptidoglycan-associated lipoprotein
MRLKLILPLLAAVALAACESTPEDTGSSTGGGAAEADTSSSSASNVSSAETQVASVEPTGPIPGSQEDLVQNVGDRVFFEFDSAVLTPEARRTLERQSEWLKLFPEVAISVEGHCDERGTREYNLALGERRANAAREYLVSQGIAASRVRTISYGKERPYALGHNEEAWALNRRSVSVIN